jgi:MarR family transcriptional regulator, organic hydroperoxide resistance regulator
MEIPITDPDPSPVEAAAGGRFRAAYWRAIRELDTIRLLQWERFHLTLPQLRILFQVQRSPGITTAQLSRAVGITVSTTSGLVAKLVDAGLVVRGQGSDDRRQIPLELTDAGRAQAGDVAEFARPFMDLLATLLGDDLEAVITALDRLAAAAAEARAAGTGEDEAPSGEEE